VDFDEVEDFVRDIEILSNDNFFSFHEILYSSIGLKNHELASFFVCDTKWNKQKEITLIDMADGEKEEVPDYAEDDEYATKSNLPKTMMADALLKECITDPHQKMIYEYDFLEPKVFYIELMKIEPAKEGVEYPRCSYKAKELPAKGLHFHPVATDTDFHPDDHWEGEFDDGYNDEDTLDLESIEDFDIDI
ncbi:MAG: plasmid pRiA4b ORF-3 family protein, partial [Bacteroidales bacterium]|nr:plasmid pRiA4b ORF-3 family protein [Bacteroidales bacterium]